MKKKRFDTIMHLGLAATLGMGVALHAAETVQIQWIRQFSFAANQFEAVRVIAADGSGVYSVGQYLTQTAPDAFVQKRDAAGNTEWQRFYGTTRGDAAYAIAVDSSGVYVGGWAGGALPGQSFVGGDDDACIRKYDFDGNEVWTREFGTMTPGISNFGRDHVLGVALTTDAVYLVGGTEGPLPGQTWLGDWDAFVRKYDKNGVEQWTRQFGTTYGESANSIAADDTGVYVFGHGGAPIDRWQLFVRKYDHSGNLLWSQQFGDPTAFNSPGGIAVDANGVYLHGTTTGTIPGQTSVGGQDNFVRKYTTSGVEVWTRQYGTTAIDGGGSIALDATGVYVTGTTRGTFPGQTSYGGEDSFARKYDLYGNVVWTIQLGTSSDDATPTIALGHSGLYVGGMTKGAFPGQTYGGGDWDALVVKLQRSPIADAGLDLVVNTSEQSGKTIQGTATDPDHDALSYRWFEGATALTDSLAAGSNGECPLNVSTLSLGEHTLTLKVGDGFFEVQDSMTLHIVDDEAPDLAPVADVTVLWPPKHQMVRVNITANATDNSGGSVTLAVGITSNEPVNGLGDGDTAPDWEVVSINQSTGAIVLRLRAERSGSGVGRVYTVTITATDTVGNTGQAQVMFLVPLIQTKP
jgi:hypothetical protein